MTRTQGVFILLLLAGILGVVTTYTQLSQTADESAHIWCGMEWWESGTYTREPKHAPLQRLMEAALPYWLDAAQAMQAMPPHKAYRTMLVLTRLGSLPFYVLSCVLVFLWSRYLFGEGAARWSLALYVFSATVSAHAGLATTDMGCAATSFWAMMAGAQWLTRPSRGAGLMLGISLGLAIGTKFSVLVHWPAAMALMLMAQIWANVRQREPVWPIRSAHLLSGLLFGLPAMLLALGLVYRFSFAPLFQGIQDLQTQNSGGFAIWLFGPLDDHAVWYFFPVVFFFKTSLPFHAANILGNVRIIRELRRGAAIERLFPLLGALGVLLPSMTSGINLGVRHVLTMYPLLAVPAGYGLQWLWQRQNGKSLLALGLLCWQIASFIAYWPDHVRYFNELAGPHPEHISLDADYDWDQDLILLDKVLQRRHVDTVYACLRRLAINRNLMAARAVLHAQPLECPDEPVTGWIVVSDTFHQFKPDKFTWLDGYEPVQHIGTLSLYDIPQ